IGVDEHLREPGLVVYLGNLAWRKGVFHALEAAELVTRKVPSARFVFAGTARGEDLGRWRSELDKHERISLVPPVAGFAKRRLLQRASVLLFPPARPEGHPRVVLEGMAAGLPVVATDRGAIAETIVDGVTGYVLPDPEPEQLAERVIRLLSDDALRQSMGEAARERYLVRFTQEYA